MCLSTFKFKYLYTWHLHILTLESRCRYYRRKAVCARTHYLRKITAIQGDADVWRVQRSQRSTAGRWTGRKPVTAAITVPRIGISLS